MGAWIETSVLGNFFTPVGVAPRVGAWIETPAVETLAASMMSHPVWVRGLKPQKYIIFALSNSRTPCGCVD